MSNVQEQRQLIENINNEVSSIRNQLIMFNEKNIPREDRPAVLQKLREFQEFLTPYTEDFD